MERLEKNAVGPRAQEAVGDWRAVSTLSCLTEISNYRYPTLDEDVIPTELIFSDNRDFWHAILTGRVTENERVELRSFWLTEWMALRPGRFHTPQAKVARDAAIANSRMVATDVVPAADVLPDRRGRTYTRIFDPFGKMSMVDGGIGCVRLKSLPNRQTHRWPLGASSSGVVHEGVPVTLDEPDRGRLIADVRRYGGLCCTLEGTLRFIPRDDLMETMFGRRIPQIYLEVNSAEPVSRNEAQQKPMDVTAVVTFWSKNEQWRGLNASYVTFDAGRRGSLEAAADWLDQVYVRKSYDGLILTDFDETTRHFEQASFSLNKLLNGLVSREDTDAIHLDKYAREKLLELCERRRLFITGDIIGDVYLIENAGAVGPHAKAANINFASNKGLSDD